MQGAGEVNERAVIGSNSAICGQELLEQVETVLGDDHKKLFHYAQWHIDDYIAGTVGLTPELEGGYIRFLMRLYQRGKPLPDDDRFMATCMNLSIRVWKRIKDSLVAVGKILLMRGCLTNARFEKERVKRAEQLRKQAGAARARHQKDRNLKEQNRKLGGSLGANLAEVSPKLPANLDEKPNEINGHDGNDPPVRALASKSLNLKAHKELLEREMREAHSPSLSPAIKGPGGVEVNGTGIKGPGFVLPYGSIDIEASMRNLPVDQARALAIAIAEGWAANGTKPRDPVREFSRILREEQTDKAKTGFFFARMNKQREDGRPDGIPDAVWQVMKLERAANAQ